MNHSRFPLPCSLPFWHVLGLVAALTFSPGPHFSVQAAEKPAKTKTKDAAANADSLKAPKSAGIRFSKARGFQSEPFELKLGLAEVPGEIRFTTDGSAPGPARGQVYQKPIPIRGTTIVRATVIGADGKASRPQTHTYLFTSDIIRQSADGLPPVGWPISWGGNAVDYGMDPFVVDDPKYKDAIQPALKSLPVYSLVMDLADLFDEAKGIYANSGNSGREWERVASVELIRPDGEKGFQEECGVRIRGGFSSGGFNPKHGFRLFFRKDYGTPKLKHPVFGAGGAQEFDSFDLRCAQNYSWNIGNDVRGLFLRDQFSRDTQRAMGQPAARGDYCQVFINGQYWGLYATCERPEASFGESNLGGNKEDYDVIKTGGLAGRGDGRMVIGATDGSMEPWIRLVNGAKADLSDNANYFKLLGRKPDGSSDPAQDVLLDPVNLIDYMLVIWYGGNLDAPVSRFGGNRMPNNWHSMRNRKTREGFRFFVWDAEHTLLDLEEDRTGPFPGGDDPGSSSPQWLFQRCADNAEFRQLVSDRVNLHFSEGGMLSPASALARFQRRVKEIEQAVIGESARWGDAGGGFPFGGPGGAPRAMRPGPDGEPKPAPRTRDGEWRAEVNRIVGDYLPKRTDIVRFQLWRQGFVSEVPSPKLGRPEGRRVTLSAPTGDVWYTTDGADPRRAGGEPSASAKRVEGSVALTGKTTLVARVRSKGDWGPAVSTTYPAN